MAKILLFGTYTNAPYHPLKGVDAILTDLLSPRFQVEATEDPDAFLSLSDPGYHLVISYADLWDHPVPDKCASALAAYIRSGGGLLALHNGISLQADPRLEDILGGKFTHHPPKCMLTFTPSEGSLLSAVPPFSLSEEPYMFQFSDPSALEPLLTFRYKGTDCPAGWKKSCGQGTVIFLCPGHTPETFQHPVYQEMIRLSVLDAEKKHQ